jgi:hypothetical protein
VTVTTVPVSQGAAVTGRRPIGIIAVALSAIAIVLIGLVAPWPIRFPALAIALLFGPGIPLLRLNSHLDLGECLVYGVGVSVSLQMLVGLVLVLAHAWVPTAAVIGLLVISGLAGVKLTMNARA